jgi:hypothetical protein
VIISVTLPLPLELPAARTTAGSAVQMSVSPRSVSARRVRRERTWVLDVEIELPELDPERLLADSEGYLVDRVDGCKLGVVDEVETVEGSGQVVALVVTGDWLGRRRFRVDAGAIDALLPADRRIVVHESGVRPLGGSGSA